MAFLCFFVFLPFLFLGGGGGLVAYGKNEATRKTSDKKKLSWPPWDLVGERLVKNIDEPPHLVERVVEWDRRYAHHSTTHVTNHTLDSIETLI